MLWNLKLTPGAPATHPPPPSHTLTGSRSAAMCCQRRGAHCVRGANASASQILKQQRPTRPTKTTRRSAPRAVMNIVADTLRCEIEAGGVTGVTCGCLLEPITWLQVYERHTNRRGSSLSRKYFRTNLIKKVHIKRSRRCNLAGWPASVAHILRH